MQYDDSWNIYQKALYYDQQGDWDRAHGLVDELSGRDAARVHAYLHRVEGDEWNAGYWYRRAGVDFFDGSLPEEWALLWEEYSKLG